MNKYQKLGLVAGQIFAGLGFALVGGIIGMLVDYYRSLANGTMNSLYGSIMTVLIFSYIGLCTGISVGGYSFLNRRGRQDEFVKFFLQSIAGLTIGFLILYIIAMSESSSKLPRGLLDSLLFILPLLGTILGFNFKLDRTKPQTTLKNKTI